MPTDFQYQFIEDEKTWFPQARNIWPLIRQRFYRNNYDDPMKIVPMYLYPEHCQVQTKY